MLEVFGDNVSPSSSVAVAPPDVLEKLISVPIPA